MELGRTPIIWWWWSTSKCKSKDISIWLKCFGLGVMCMAPLLMSIDSSKLERKCWKRIWKIFGRKEKTGSVQLRYMDDILVMGVFGAC